MRFISRFTAGGRYEQVKEAFQNGCCYWFAFILLNRFPKDSRLVYDEVENHFAAEIGGVVFDISGDITGQYDMQPWVALDDEALRRRLIRDCILF